ncbi:hypothetical protein HPB52_015005 [Rhipicephalus sanguineus]|uniref:T-box domain-containing protein n=1 Tax=Rhipicephalus sanguineus TaxID=34632 RepID=A0A9D4PZ60_RHISA|nr:hypothetical protein HPB52_015005 [Rhipicephalus sanguineus]
MQWIAWSTFPRRVMDVNDSARVDCPIFLADNSDGFTFVSSTFTLDPALDKTNVTLDGPIIDRPSSTTAWSTAIKASPADSFTSGRGNSGVGTMLIRCLFITQQLLAARRNGHGLVAGRNGGGGKVYLHENGPCLGCKWMLAPVDFSAVKLTNQKSNTAQKMMLQSMRKYVPRIHVFAGSDVQKLDFRSFKTFVFPETGFISVTSYQNDQLTTASHCSRPALKKLFVHRPPPVLALRHQFSNSCRA